MSNTVFTKENFDKLSKVVKDHKGKEGGLMPVLQEAQKIFGCVSMEVQQKIAEEMNLPLAEVYGVATFYSQFSLEPKGENVIGVCLGTACYVKGSQDILDKISSKLNLKVGQTSEDGKFTLNATRCVGACGLAPVITINEEVYGKVKIEDLDEIFSKYK